MADNELTSFRDKWKQEIERKHSTEKNKNIYLSKSDSTAIWPNISDSTTMCMGTNFNHAATEDSSSSSNCKSFDCRENAQTVSKRAKLEPIALLTLEIPSLSYQAILSADNNTCTNKPHASLADHHDNEDLISLLIRDIDETTSIPFFDITLPKEVCIKIFSQLNVADLCMCARVSKAWASIANDELIWYNIHQQLGFKNQGSVNENVGWKDIVRDQILRQRLVTRNWKERICQIQTLEYEKGGTLTACQLHGDLVIAGYANGKTCLWNVENNWRHSLEASAEAYQDLSTASVECVDVVGDVCATAFTCGIVNVWHADISVDPIYQYHVGKPANHIALTAKDTRLLLNVNGADVRVDSVNAEGHWQYMHSHTFEEQVKFVEKLPDAKGTLFAFALREDILIYEARLNALKELDKISGTKVTSFGCGEEFIAVGWAPFGFGIGSEFTAKVRLYETASLKHAGSFRGHYADITCLNLSFTGSFVTGSKDKRVRVYDLRTDEPQMSLRAHSSTVTTVQMDSWKLVSGAFDGTVKVWDLRIGGVLWETRASHPVRLSVFNDERLVTANIPEDRIARGNMWYADDLIQHRRHRGTVQLYDFGTEAGVIAPEEMRSNYDDIAGYNYNINLVAPYDALTSEIN